MSSLTVDTTSENAQNGAIIDPTVVLFERRCAAFMIATMVEVLANPIHHADFNGQTFHVVDLAFILNNITQDNQSAEYQSIAQNLYIDPVFLGHGIRLFKALLRKLGGTRDVSWQITQTKASQSHIPATYTFPEILPISGGDLVTVALSHNRPWHTVALQNATNTSSLLMRIHGTKDHLFNAKASDGWVEPSDCTTLSEVFRVDVSFERFHRELDNSRTIQRPMSLGEKVMDLFGLGSVGKGNGGSGQLLSPQQQKDKRQRIGSNPPPLQGTGDLSSTWRDSSPPPDDLLSPPPPTTTTTDPLSVRKRVLDDPLESNFNPLGDFRYLRGQLIDIQEDLDARCSSYKDYNDKVLDGSADIASILREQRANHASKASGLFACFMELLMGSGKRKELRQRTAGVTDEAKENVWRGWCSGQAASIGDFRHVRNWESSTADSRADLTVYVRNLQMKVELMLQFFVAIRSENQVVTDAVFAMGRLLKIGGASNTTINKISEIGLCSSASQVVSTDVPNAAKGWFDQQFVAIVRLTNEGKVAVISTMDNFCYLKWLQEQAQGKKFTTSFNSITGIVHTVFLPDYFPPITSETPSFSCEYDESQRNATTATVYGNSLLGFLEAILTDNVSGEPIHDVNPAHLSEFSSYASFPMLSSDMIQNVKLIVMEKAVLGEHTLRIVCMDPEFGQFLMKCALLASQNRRYSKSFRDLMSRIAPFPAPWHYKNHLQDCWLENSINHMFLYAPLCTFIGFKDRVYNPSLPSKFANTFNGIKLTAEETCAMLDKEVPAAATTTPKTTVPTGADSSTSIPSMDGSESVDAEEGDSCSDSSSAAGDVDPDDEAFRLDETMNREEGFPVHERMPVDEEMNEDDLDRIFCAENEPGLRGKTFPTLPRLPAEINAVVAFISLETDIRQAETEFANNRGRYKNPNKAEEVYQPNLRSYGPTRKPISFKLSPRLAAYQSAHRVLMSTLHTNKARRLHNANLLACAYRIFQSSSSFASLTQKNALTRLINRQLLVLNDFACEPFLDYDVRGNPFPFWSRLPSMSLLLLAGGKPKIHRLAGFYIAQLKYLSETAPHVLKLAAECCTKLSELWVELRNSIISTGCTRAHVQSMQQLRTVSVQTAYATVTRKSDRDIFERGRKIPETALVSLQLSSTGTSSTDVVVPPVAAAVPSAHYQGDDDSDDELPDFDLIRAPGEKYGEPEPDTSSGSGSSSANTDSVETPPAPPPPVQRPSEPMRLSSRWLPGGSKIAYAKDLVERFLEPLFQSFGNTVLSAEQTRLFDNYDMLGMEKSRVPIHAADLEDYIKIIAGVEEKAVEAAFLVAYPHAIPSSVPAVSDSSRTMDEFLGFLDLQVFKGKGKKTLSKVMDCLDPSAPRYPPEWLDSTWRPEGKNKKEQVRNSIYDAFIHQETPANALLHFKRFCKEQNILYEDKVYDPNNVKTSRGKSAALAPAIDAMVASMQANKQPALDMFGNMSWDTNTSLLLPMK